MIEPYYMTDNGSLLNCDVLTGLRSMADESVDCCITSPPYWGLRDYGLPPQIWDAQGGCEHVWGDERLSSQRQRNKAPGGIHEDRKEGTQDVMLHPSQGQFCQHCNAWRGSLGLEPTPELFISHLVQIFREVKRVLKDSGTLWVNMGDSYAGSWGDSGNRPERSKVNQGQRERKTQYFTREGHPRDPSPPTISALKSSSLNLKPKDLVGAPWMLAFALRADGWYLRSDIIWHKPNPMPESVIDRPTKAHEYIFLLSKSKKYFYDSEAIKEPAVNKNMPGTNMTDTRTTHASWSGGNQGLKDMKKRYKEGNWPVARNKRSVWTVTTKPYKEAHFATFPPDLIEPCIKAGCPDTGTVLDPFFGSGTTGIVAEKYDRAWVGIELSTDYCAMAKDRLEQATRQQKLL